MMPTTVLIAVPDLLFRSKLRDAARGAGADTQSASSYDAVLARARETKPAVLVVDLGDERLKPFDLIAAVKSFPETASVRIVGFFAHVRLEQRDAARVAGCDVILPRSAVVAALAELLDDASSNRPDGAD